jgi:hypothetical protein
VDSAIISTKWQNPSREVSSLRPGNLARLTEWKNSVLCLGAAFVIGVGDNEIR